MSWPFEQIGAYARVQSGFAFKSADWRSEGVPVVRIKNIQSGWLDMSDCAYVSPEVAAAAPKSLLNLGDLLITMTGAIGDRALVRDDQPIVLNQRVGRFRITDPERLDNCYLYYALGLSEVRAHLEQVAHGVAQANISPSTIGECRIPLPPLPSQRRIVGFLSVYDDLIENNTRRIAILENMARRLFEEWFVHYRGPNGEDDCASVRLDTICDVIRGRSYRSVDLNDEAGLPFVNLKCVQRDGGFRLDGLKSYSGQYKPAQAVRTGDIVMAVTDMTQERRIVARSAMVPRLPSELGVISMDLVKIEPKPDVPPTYLYALLRWSNFAHEVKQHANGANVLHLSPKLVESAEVDVVARSAMKQFADMIAPMLEQIALLEAANTPLRAARDLLLPELISGEIGLQSTGAADLPNLAPELAVAAE